MNDFIHRLEGLVGFSYYMAPDDGKVRPVKTPENHETVELITGGEVFFEVNGKTESYGKGTIFWHRGGEYTVYRTTPENPYRCASFGFSVSDSCRPVGRVSFWNDNSSVERFSSECLNYFHSNQMNRDVLACYAYSTLLFHAEAFDKFSRRNYPAPLYRALNYIDKNLNHKITIAGLAKKSQISQPQLFKLFQTHLSITPHHYILSQQLAKSRTMLAGTLSPIKAIAEECGFGSLEVFYRHFRRESSMPPNEYRRKHQRD